QAAGELGRQGRRVLVVSAEESAQQVAMRADRLGIEGGGVVLVADDDVDRVLAAADDDPPDLMIVDSIQTVLTQDASGSPGGVTQKRESADRNIRFAKDPYIAPSLAATV